MCSTQVNDKLTGELSLFCPLEVVVIIKNRITRSKKMVSIVRNQTRFPGRCIIAMGEGIAFQKHTIPS
jgi:hypothetical protein